MMGIPWAQWGLAGRREKLKENSNREMERERGTSRLQGLGMRRADLHLNHKPGRIAPLLVTRGVS